MMAVQIASTSAKVTKDDTMAKRITMTSPADAPETLIGQGRYWATTAELEKLTGRHDAQLRPALARLIRRGEMFSPARGFYVMIPPEYRAWRVVPAEWFVDALMQHLKRSYYVGFLTSAAMHGAAHQAPQTFRVVTDRSLADRDIERVQLRFTVAGHISDMPTEQRTVPTGKLVIASRETTVIDISWRPSLAGGISNVATVIKEIGELDGEVLARIAPLRSQATVRRVGWLVEQFRSDVDMHWLRVVARPDEGEPALLVPGERTGPLDKAWGIRVNAKVESDV